MPQLVFSVVLIAVVYQGVVVVGNSAVHDMREEVLFLFLLANDL